MRALPIVLLAAASGCGILLGTTDDDLPQRVPPAADAGTDASMPVDGAATDDVAVDAATEADAAPDASPDAPPPTWCQTQAPSLLCLDFDDGTALTPTSAANGGTLAIAPGGYASANGLQAYTPDNTASAMTAFTVGAYVAGATLTLDFWFYVAAFGPDKGFITIATLGGPSGDHLAILVDSNYPELLVEWQTVTGQVVDTLQGSTYAVGSWTHFTLSLDATQVHFAGQAMPLQAMGTPLALGLGIAKDLSGGPTTIRLDDVTVRH